MMTIKDKKIHWYVHCRSTK